MNLTVMARWTLKSRAGKNCRSILAGEDPVPGPISDQVMAAIGLCGIEHCLQLGLERGVARQCSYQAAGDLNIAKVA